MDILCERCGEPWDLVGLELDMIPIDAVRLKAGQGCPCCYGKQPCQREVWCDDCDEFEGWRCNLQLFKPRAKEAREVQAALRSVLGNDLDGLAAEMEDLVSETGVAVAAWK